MDEMDAFERQVADIARRVAGLPRPVDALAVARSVAAPSVRTSLVRSGITRGTTTFAPWRRRSALATLLLVAATLAVVAGGFVLTVGTPSTPDGEDAFPAILPAVIPADIEQGTIDTPIGRARWVHVRGDPTTPALPLTPMPGPNGLLWFDGDRLWASDDAISERTELPLPVEAGSAQLTPLDGTLWLTTSEPTTLWRSPDAVRWQPVDLSALVSPGPAELDWEVSLGVPASSNGATVIPVTYRARDAGRLLGLPDLDPEQRYLWHVWPERFAWVERAPSNAFQVIQGGDGGGLEVGEVRIEETADGLRLQDAAGRAIAELDGVGADFLEAWSANQAIVEHHVALVDGGMVTPATLPGAWLSDRYGKEGPTVLGTSAGYHAYQPAADGTIRTWRSADGRTWTELDPIGEEEGEPRGERGIEIHLDHGWGRDPVVVAVRVEDDGRRNRVRVWESADGTTWTGAPDVYDEMPQRLGERWLAWSGSTGWSASRDGRAWEAVPGLFDVIATAEWVDGGSAWRTVGDAVFLAVYDAEQEVRLRDLWIFELEAEQK
jgi:hypothetical protein